MTYQSNLRYVTAIAVAVPHRECRIRAKFCRVALVISGLDTAQPSLFFGEKNKKTPEIVQDVQNTTTGRSLFRIKKAGYDALQVFLATEK